MSDTETELEREMPQAAMKGRPPDSATEPVADLPATEAIDQSPTQPESPPHEPSATAVATEKPTAAAPTPRRRQRRHQSPGFPWEASPLARFPMDELRAEIDRRHARARVLTAERGRILAQMAELEAQMGFAVRPDRSATPADRPLQATRPPRQRPRNSVSLADALAMAVEPRATVTPAEAAQLVTSNGYQSSAKNFGMVVANALAKDARFARRSRGQYERIAE